jgi:hypothetical protein
MCSPEISGVRRGYLFTSARIQDCTDKQRI